MGKTLMEIFHDIAEKNETFRFDKERYEQQRRHEILTRTKADNYGF